MVRNYILSSAKTEKFFQPKFLGLDNIISLSRLYRVTKRYILYILLGNQIAISGKIKINTIPRNVNIINGRAE